MRRAVSLACGFTIMLMSLSPTHAGDQVTAPAVTKVALRSSALAPGAHFVDAHVNGQGPYTFFFDTGAARTVLSNQLATTLGVKRIGEAEAQSGHGKLEISIGRIESLMVGDAAVGDLEIGITEFFDQISETLGEPIGGTVGYDFLKNFLVTLDYPSSFVLLRPADHETGEAGDSAGVPFRLADPDKKPIILVSAQINGEGSYTFVVDTGAGMSVLSREVAEARGIEALGQVQIPNVQGASIGTLDSLVVGGTRVDDLSVVVGDILKPISEAVGEELDGIIGVNFLNRFRVTIDYAKETVRFDSADS